MGIEDRCAGTQLAKQVLELIREDYNQLTSEGRLSFAEFFRERFFPTPLVANEVREPFRHREVQQDPVAEALAVCEEILCAIEDLPLEGEDFGESVAEKTRSIQATIERKNQVTPGQYTALKNMLGGLENWRRE